MNIMPKLTRRAVLLGSAAFIAAGCLILGTQSLQADDQSPSASSPATVSAISRPSQESKLAFGAPGLVSNISVKDGDVVKKGQILAEQDSRQDEFTYKSLKADADSDDKVKYSTEDEAMKEVQDKRKKDLFAQHVASQSELEEADLAVDLAVAQIALAKLDHEQKNFDADKQAVKIEQMKIAAPYDGIIEHVVINPGEMADPQSKDGAIVIGQWDPLWVEMHLPSSQAAQLKLGQTLETKFEGDTDWKPAKIIFFEHVDAASDTQMVRLELANPGNAHPAGLHVEVKLPDKLVASAAR
jgi:macrolide-specific efflux system membrane fusion protein